MCFSRISPEPLELQGTKAINDREGRKKLCCPKKITYGKDLPLDISPIQLIYLFMGQFLQKSIFKNMSFFQKLSTFTLSNNQFIISSLVAHLLRRRICNQLARVRSRARVGLICLLLYLLTHQWSFFLFFNFFSIIVLSWLHLKLVSVHIAARLRTTRALLFWRMRPAAADWTLLIDERSFTVHVHSNM